MTTAVAVETERIADKQGEVIAAVTAVKRTLASAGQDGHRVAELFERGAGMPVTCADEPD
jgi:hypothetical protein